LTLPPQLQINASAVLEQEIPALLEHEGLGKLIRRLRACVYMPRPFRSNPNPVLWVFRLPVLSADQEPVPRWPELRQFVFESATVADRVTIPVPVIVSSSHGSFLLQPHAHGDVVRIQACRLEGGKQNVPGAVPGFAVVHKPSVLPEVQVAVVPTV